MMVGVANFGLIFLCKNKFKVQNLSLENEVFFCICSCSCYSCLNEYERFCSSN